MTEVKERAAELADELNMKVRLTVEPVIAFNELPGIKTTINLDTAIPIIERALLAQRDEALEEAAKYVEIYFFPIDAEDSCLGDRVKTSLSKAIRALKSTTAGGEG